MLIGDSRLDGRKPLLGPGPAHAAIAVAVLLAGCTPERKEDPQPPVEAPPPAAKAPATPPALPAALSRADILEAAAQAASAYALGASPAPDRKSLVGQRFELRMPFGCAGPAKQNDSDQASWRYGADGKTIRISVQPGDWTGTILARELGGPEAFERIEGYWIPRPWLLAADCPTVRADPLQSGQSSPSPNTLGLVTLHEAGGSRLEGRGGRPYEVTLKTPEDNTRPAPQGYRLMLSGRITGFPNGQAFHCRASSPDQRPVCILAVAIERVAIEEPSRGEVVGEWRN